MVKYESEIMLAILFNNYWCYSTMHLCKFNCLKSLLGKFKRVLFNATFFTGITQLIQESATIFLCFCVYKLHYISWTLNSQSLDLTANTQWRRKSKKLEMFSGIWHTNMLWPQPKIWVWMVILSSVMLAMSLSFIFLWVRPYLWILFEFH